MSVALPSTPSFRLEGKRALTTGGGRGIGLAAAAALAEAGAHVCLVARTGADVEAVAQALRERGHSADAVSLDITDIPRTADFIASSEPFDILVNNAGLARHRPVLEVDVESYDTVMALNVRAAYFLAQAVARRLMETQRPGSIINMSSQMGLVGGPKRSVYCATKFAMEGFTRAMAIELGPHRIRVNTLCPTFIETPLSAGSLGDPEFRAWVLTKIKLGRLGIVEDLMGPVVFLASEASAMMTGSSLVVDGGWTAH